MRPRPTLSQDQPTPSRATPSLRCLVVDDDREVAATLSDILAWAGHTTVVCTDPAAAISQAQAERFDAIFTDLAMPGMPGWQVARAIKTANPTTAVLVMTGYRVEISPEEQDHRWVDMVLTKPVAMNAILHALARAVSRADHAAGPRSADARSLT